MDLTPVTEAIQQNPVWAVFANVLLQQLGLPLPVMPTLLVAGSLAGSPVQGVQMLAAAVFASLFADWLWYLAGRAFGYRVLSVLCRLSINPGSCVSETEARFIRWGVWSLVVAKFVPGFSTVAPPIAGSLRMPLPSFIAAASLGAAIWAGAALCAGWLMRSEVQFAVDLTSRHGTEAIAAIALGLCAWLTWIPHITPAELAAALRSDTPPLLLDFRGAAMIAQTGPIAGAVQAHIDDLPGAVGDWPKHGHIVTLCACPGDAGAVRAARSLVNMGYSSVRPLKGGYEAWIAHLGRHAS
jgi:membrane protein DedA with SNARE-associated domain/rhodanese-related sulfurtransferase